jgi:hypothetical protein
MIHIEIRKLYTRTSYGEKVLKNFKLIETTYEKRYEEKIDCYLSIFTGSGHISNRKEFTIRIPNFNLKANYGLTIDFSFKKSTIYCNSKYNNRFFNYFRLPVEQNYY